MAAINKEPDMVRVSNEAFLRKAAECAPVLKEVKVHPVSIVEMCTTNGAYPEVVQVEPAECMKEHHLQKGDRLCFDFGDHQVGYVSLKLASVGSPQDAPAFFRLKFGEIAKEMVEDSKDYDGWISRSWIQEEQFHVDVLPCVLELPRRYAFRYMEIEVIDTSMKWQLVVEEITCKAVSAVSIEDVALARCDDETVRRLDRVSLRTLQNCMQNVFEDGPKRDRRLWLGDLRLQALANYETFKRFDLVKRCLYLFAGQTKENGQVSACLFTEPEIIADDTFLLDYSMFFGATLLDYYKASGDMETLRELSKCAYRQMQIAKERSDENDLMASFGDFTEFIDWTEGLDKQAALQGIYIYCAKRVKEIAEILGDTEKATEMKKEAEAKTEAAWNYLYDGEMELFVSGPDRQVNYASQVWLVLAGITDEKTGGEILDRVIFRNPEKGMVSPYMNHHFVEALLMCGRKEQAMNYMKYYWGGMLNYGADTFWELYNPENPAESPYGSSIVNSYCHAWSCTPAYLLRKYYTDLF
ncbi:MAG: cellobiose phosphorylase [Lachnospiraceae bacterium]